MKEVCKEGREGMRKGTRTVVGTEEGGRE